MNLNPIDDSTSQIAGEGNLNGQIANGFRGLQRLFSDTFRWWKKDFAAAPIWPRPSRFSSRCFGLDPPRHLSGTAYASETKPAPSGKNSAGDKTLLGGLAALMLTYALRFSPTAIGKSTFPRGSKPSDKGRLAPAACRLIRKFPSSSGSLPI